MACPAGRGPGGVPRAAADAIEAAGEELAMQIVGEIGKPLRYARAEVRRGAALLRVAARLADPPTDRPAMPRSDASRSGPSRRSPRSTTRWPCPSENSPRPFATATGGLKPSPAGLGVAERVVELLRLAGMPPSWCRCSQGARTPRRP